MKPNAYLANAIDLVDEMVKSGDERWVDATFQTKNWKPGTVGFRSPKSAGVSPQALNMVNLGASLGAVSQWAKRNQGGGVKIGWSKDT